MIKYKDINTGQIYDQIPKGKVQPLIVNGQAVTEQAYNNYYNQNPIQLQELVVNPNQTYSENIQPMETEQNMFHRARVQGEDARVAEATAFHKPLNYLSPGQWFGAAIDYVQGEAPFWKGIYDGNSGWMPNIINEKFPRFSILGNAIIDGLVTHHINNAYKWGTTPKLIGEGAEARVYSAPFWRYVYKVGLDPEHVKLKNEVANTVKHKYVGNTLDGEPIYKQRKVQLINKFNKRKLSRMYQNLANQGFYPNQMDETFIDVINPTKQLFVTDISTGNVGKFWPFGKYKLIDPAVFNDASDYIMMYEKNGGKLNKYSYDTNTQNK